MVIFDYQIVLAVVEANESPMQLGVALKDNLSSMSTIATC